MIEKEIQLSSDELNEVWKLKDYEIKSVLGAGSYGVVVEAWHKQKNQYFAIKKISHLFNNFNETKRILREITIMRKIKHPNIVQIFDILIEGEPETFTTIYVVMEFLPSDLKKLINSPIYLTNEHL